MRPKKQKLKKDGTPYKPRKGWGPYRSVPNERSVAFNLQLDVQNLQQEVQSLLTLRDILQTKTLVQRHTPEGSLTRLVNEYLFVFRKGVVPHQPERGRIVEERDQRAFMRSVMDPDVELGPGLPRGPDVIMDQMANYSNFLHFILLTGVVDSIIVTEDSVLITDAASFVFQVTRSTIEMVFPHIIGNEWLVAQLVGQEAEAQGRSTFHFNSAGKCYKYDVEMNFVEAFMDIVKDPRIVDVLLGRALITYNGMLGITYEDWEPKEEEKAQASHHDNEVNVVYEGNTWDNEQNDASQALKVAAGKSTQCSASSTSAEFCRKIVEDYFSAFSTGYEENTVTPIGVTQKEFSLHRFGSRKEAEAKPIVKHVKERWRVLNKSFKVLSFQRKGAAIQTEWSVDGSSCLVVSEATYLLRITMDSIQSVFPHLFFNTKLLDTLVGKVITVPSQIIFSIEKTTGHISEINEQMDFDVAIADIVSDPQDFSRVISQARLTRDGVGYTTYRSASRSCDGEIQRSLERKRCENRLDISLTANRSSRTMNVADILD